ncbi:MAG: hypothetical protein L0H24_01125 [Microlunatus sp.]|nr:hypothetical protein [Microlunatus sp.]
MVMLLVTLAPGGHLLAMAAGSLWMWQIMLAEPGPRRWSLRLPWRFARLVSFMVRASLQRRAD